MLSGRLLKNESNDLHYNMALEHAILLLHQQNDHSLTLRLWRNPKSVIIGRSQLIDMEVDRGYCSRNGIEVARRISGGGAVYQDEGNLNVSIFAPRKAMRNRDDIHSVGALMADLIVDSIRKVGFEEIERQGCYNILHHGLKVSGAAFYFTRDYCLYHATLLISANLKHLEGSLLHNGAEKNYRSRSRYSPTTNLEGLDIDKWEASFIGLLEQEFGAEFKPDVITPLEHDLAVKLRDSMYSNPIWIVQGKRTHYSLEQLIYPT